MEKTQIAIEIRGLSFSYPKRAVFEDLSISIKRGEFFGIVGPNGGGKTTFFRILSTLIAPSNGEIYVSSISTLKEPDRARKKYGVVFQNPSLDARLTVTENLWHQGHLYGLRGNELKRRIERRLEELQIIDRRGDVVGELSGGLKRRVEIAKALLHEPEILLLDEPSIGLDPGVRRDMWRVLTKLRESTGVTTVFTTHILEEADLCDTVAILHHGKIVAMGSPRDLRRSIDGEVISVVTDDPELLANKIHEKFGAQSSIVDGKLRIEHRDGNEFLHRLYQEFSSDVESVTLRRPTLEDVFIQKTGDRFMETVSP